MQNSDVAWEAWGKRDPYFGVLTDERYRLDRIEAHRDEFFASGEAFVGHSLHNFEQSFGPINRGRALDFGCGVGRLTNALASRFNEVVGLDISPSMLVEARKAPNIVYALADDALSHANGSFDFVNTYIVLQHIPLKRSMLIVQRLVERVAVGGGFLIHVAIQRPSNKLRRAIYWLRFNVPAASALINITRRRPAREPAMQMNEASVPDLLALFARRGVRDLRVMLEDHNGVLTAIFMGRVPPA